MIDFAVNRDEQGRPDGPPAASTVEKLNASQAATRLGVSERTIRRAIQRGDLVATRHGREHQIAIDALDRFGQARDGHGRGAVRPQLALVPFPVVERPRRFSPPAPLNLFVGRAQEVTTVSHLLRREYVRLVTLTGPGGVGKTRLSLQIAADLTKVYADGTCFVPLAAVRDPALVPSTIAVALDVRGAKRSLHGSGCWRSCVTAKCCWCSTTSSR